MKYDDLLDPEWDHLRSFRTVPFPWSGRTQDKGTLLRNEMLKRYQKRKSQSKEGFPFDTLDHFRHGSLNGAEPVAPKKNPNPFNSSVKLPETKAAWQQTADSVVQIPLVIVAIWVVKLITVTLLRALGFVLLLCCAYGVWQFLHFLQ